MRIAWLMTAGALGLAGCASAPTAAPPAPANASTATRGVVNLASASGSLVSGRLTLRPMADGVRVSGQIGGLAPGSLHGFHIHEKGDCSAADAASAGGHFNPMASMHGRAGMGASHAGDIDNIVADASGVAQVEARVMGVTLGGGGAGDIAGRAFMVHAAADDYTAQPGGNSGARVACGVITVTP